MTTVINIKDAPAGWMSNPAYVYIGRERAGGINRYQPLAEQTIATGEWGNPFVLRFEKHRELIFSSYARWLSKQPKEFLARMDRELWGRTLVCFCKPKLCHGDVIARYVDRNSNEPYDWDFKLESPQNT